MTETGWGEFDIIIKIFFVPEAFEKPITFTHHLKLHPWPLDPTLSLAPPPLPTDPSVDPSVAPPPVPDTPPVILSPIHSWQYEEIIFAEPTETFYSILLSHTPTGLPPSNRHPRILQHPLSGGGNIGEFSLEMEKEEGDRLEAARAKVLGEMEEMRKRLVGNEQVLGGEWVCGECKRGSADCVARRRTQEGGRGADCSASSSGGVMGRI